MRLAYFLAAGHCFSNRGSGFGVRRSGFVPLRCVWHFLLPRLILSYLVEAKGGQLKFRGLAIVFRGRIELCAVRLIIGSHNKEKNGTARRPSLPKRRTSLAASHYLPAYLLRLRS